MVHKRELLVSRNMHIHIPTFRSQLSFAMRLEFSKNVFYSTHCHIIVTCLLFHTPVIYIWNVAVKCAKALMYIDRRCPPTSFYNLFQGQHDEKSNYDTFLIPKIIGVLQIFTAIRRTDGYRISNTNLMWIIHDISRSCKSNHIFTTSFHLLDENFSEISSRIAEF